MNYLLNFYNQTAAGPTILTKIFLNTFLSEIKNGRDEFKIILPRLSSYMDLNAEQKTQKNVKIFYLPYWGGFGKLLINFLYNFLFPPLIALFFRPKAILNFGNFAPVPLFSKKIILMHHPYLVDDELFAEANFITKFVETIKRIVFYLTARTSNSFVVETNFMKDKLIEKYNVLENNVHVIKNPINRSLYESSRRCSEKDKIPYKKRKIILYVSRYASHKGYDLILNLVKKYYNKFQNAQVKIYITIDANLSKEAAEYIEKINLHNLDTIIKNLGEIPNEKLENYYKQALCFFFPSKSETCGLPLIEAMAFGLPIVVPDLAYAHVVCGRAALYYKSNKIDDAFQKILSVCQDESLWKRYSLKSIGQFDKYPTAQRWVRDYLNLLRS
jgi:glycosyltransferase involved in cell wall biosynthesis